VDYTVKPDPEEKPATQPEAQTAKEPEPQPQNVPEHEDRRQPSATTFDAGQSAFDFGEPVAAGDGPGF